MAYISTNEPTIPKIDQLKSSISFTCLIRTFEKDDMTNETNTALSWKLQLYVDRVKWEYLRFKPCKIEPPFNTLNSLKGIDHLVDSRVDKRIILELILRKQNLNWI
jgi:hypothetical protein